MSHDAFDAEYECGECRALDLINFFVDSFFG